MAEGVTATVEQDAAQVVNQETTPSNYLNVIKTLIQNGGKRINSNRIKNVNYTEKDNYTMVSLTLTNPIPGYISEDNGLTYKLGHTNVVFTSLYAIVGALKEDEDLSWLGNALLNKPSALNLILNGGVVDIIQQEIPANTVFTNPFSTSANPESQVYGHDIILNHCIKFRLGKTGREMSMMLAKSMMGF